VAGVALVGLAVTWWLGDGRLNREASLPAAGGVQQVAVLETPAPRVSGDERAPAVERVTVKEIVPLESNHPAEAPAAPGPAALSDQRLAAVSDPGGVISGRVVDASDSTVVAQANVLLVGTARGVATDSTGAFRFDRLEPGRRYELQVVRLGYAPLDVAIEMPRTGNAVVACSLEPVVVATMRGSEARGGNDLAEINVATTVDEVRSRSFDKYAIDSVEEALSKQAGIVARAGELSAGDGRPAKGAKRSDGRAAPSASPIDQSLVGLSAGGVRPGPPSPFMPGSVTGGTTPPNGETFELMYFKSVGVNPFVSTDEDTLSTFALDVDNASFSLARSYLDRGVLPPAGAIRVEEFVNAMDAGWPAHTQETFRIGLDGGSSRFGQGYHLLRVSVVGRSVESDERKPANLVFVIDISGSMDRESRLGAVKRALHTLVDELGEGDRVGLVVYGSRGEIRLPLTDVSRRETILGVIDGLQPGGSTNAAEGLQLGYRVAREGFDAGHINRLILCSDGVANTGDATDAEGILALARRGLDEGVTLSTVGFGMGNYNDVLLEQLADQGDGNYFYVDRPQEAERVFRENLTGLLQTIARQAKVQVEFDPRRVSRWRLLGYENRDVADRDFRNDAVDAGEVGAGHQVTALYEIKLIDGARGDDDDRVGTVHLRWEAPEHDTARLGQVTEIERGLTRAMFDVSEQAGSPHRRAQALAAEFAEILRGSYWAKDSRLSALVPLAKALVGQLGDEPAVRDLARMIGQAADLQEARSDPLRGDDKE
jgi:Ca-activated chloride channel family protein